MRKIFLAAFLFLALPLTSWADIGFGAVQGVSLPAKKQVIGGFACFEKGPFDVGVMYRYHFLSLKNAHALGAEGGVSLQKRGMFFRLFASPTAVWGANEVSTTFTPTPDSSKTMIPVTLYRNLPTRFEITAGLEIGVLLNLKDIPGRQRFAVRAEYLPDAFDGRLGGKGGDWAVLARLSFHFFRE